MSSPIDREALDPGSGDGSGRRSGPRVGPRDPRNFGLHPDTNAGTTRPHPYGRETRCPERIRRLRRVGGDDAFVEAPACLDDLSEQQTVAHVVDRDVLHPSECFAQPAPQPEPCAVVVVVVETAARGSSAAVVSIDHVVAHPVRLVGPPRAAGRFDGGTLLPLHRTVEGQRDLVEKLQRGNRISRILRRIFDEARVDSGTDGDQRFVEISLHDAAREEPPAVAHDDGCLSEQPRILQSGRQGLFGCARTDDRLHQPHPVDRREEVHADERLRARQRGREGRDRQRRRRRCEHGAGLGDRFDRLQNLLFDGDVLGHGFDHQRGGAEVREAFGDLDAIEQSS
ncbi:hypothetical protein NJ76_00300 [Rhodococcus sp. IITR03]|nr:hypothetical protein NJ76_00300 [Rhodococcus sp. IITR03]